MIPELEIKTGELQEKKKEKMGGGGEKRGFWQLFYRKNEFYQARFYDKKSIIVTSLPNKKVLKTNFQ